MSSTEWEAVVGTVAGRMDQGFMRLVKVVVACGRWAEGRNSSRNTFEMRIAACPIMPPPAQKDRPAPVEWLPSCPQARWYEAR